MSEFAIYVKQGGYIGRGSYSVQGEIFKVLTTRIEEHTRIFKTKEAAEKALERMYGKYANLFDAEVVEIERWKLEQLKEQK